MASALPDERLGPSHAAHDRVSVTAHVVLLHSVFPLWSRAVLTGRNSLPTMTRTKRQWVRGDPDSFAGCKIVYDAHTQRVLYGAGSTLLAAVLQTLWLRTRSFHGCIGCKISGLRLWTSGSPPHSQTYSLTEALTFDLPRYVSPASPALGHPRLHVLRCARTVSVPLQRHVCKRSVGPPRGTSG